MKAGKKKDLEQKKKHQVKEDKQTEIQWSRVNKVDMMRPVGLSWPTSLEKRSVSLVGLGVYAGHWALLDGERRWRASVQAAGSWQYSVSLIGVMSRSHMVRSQQCIMNTTEKCPHICRVTAYMSSEICNTECHEHMYLKTNVQNYKRYKGTETVVSEDMHTYTAGEVHRSTALSMLVPGRSRVTRGEVRTWDAWRIQPL